MRIKTLILIFPFLFTLNFAQTINNYGVKFGIVSSKMNVKLNPNDIYVGFGTNNFYENRRTGISVGGFLLLFDYDYLNMETELLYYEEGAEDKIAITSSESPEPIDELTWDHEYSFLRLGINIRPTYKFSKDKISLIFGPTINHLLINRDSFYLRQKLKDIYFGYNIGLSYVFAFMAHPIFLELKFSDYFADFVNNSQLKANISSININIGVMLK